jgi:hypothetical protein
LRRKVKERRVFYQIKVLIAAAAIYIAYKDVTAAGAVEQARTVVNEVEKQRR